MSKNEYLNALKQALAGLPPDVAARTMAFYEQRFIDGLAAGRSEDEIAADLDEPRKIAMTLRANAHMGAFQQNKSPLNLARVIFSLIGLSIFNLFMVVPAAVFSALLMGMYASAFALYVSGIAITASGLAGANELELSGPLRHLVIYDDDGEAIDTQVRTKVSISEQGVDVFRDPPASPAKDGDEAGQSGRLLESAEAMAGGGVRISTDLDNESRATQTAVGVGLIVLGIVLSLLSIMLTRYSLIGLKRYIQMNAALLRGR